MYEMTDRTGVIRKPEFHREELKVRLKIHRAAPQVRTHDRFFRHMETDDGGVFGAVGLT